MNAIIFIINEQRQPDLRAVERAGRKAGWIIATILILVWVL